MKASSFARKVKHLTRGKYVLVNSRDNFTWLCLFRFCPRCEWRGLQARTFRRRSIWNVYRGIIRREAMRFFAVCPGCSYWEEVR